MSGYVSGIRLLRGIQCEAGPGAANAGWPLA